MDDVTSIASNSSVNDTGMSAYGTAVLEVGRDGNIIAMKTKASSKGRFYANIDYKAEKGGE